MAESEKGAVKSPGGSNTWKTLIRTFSFRKLHENAEAAPDDPASDTKPASPDTQKSPTTEDGFSSKLRKSFRRLKSIQEVTNSTELEKESTNKEDFAYIIPQKPLSVMEINNLIETEALKKAYLNIVSLQKEFQCEQEALGEKVSIVNLDKKKKDLDMLYKALKDKLANIICQSCTQHFTNRKLLVQVAGIIQDKEKRELGAVKEWRDVWKSAVQQGVKEALQNSCEQNLSCTGDHFELLGKKIVELLEMVKAEILNLYPPSFPVFETYASSCNEFVEDHLKMLLEKKREQGDYNAMLHFAVNQYHRDIISRPSFQPAMKQQTFLTLSGDLLGQIKEAYCVCMQENVHASLSNVINTEQEEVWKKKITPKRTKDGVFLISDLSMNVCETIKKYSESCAKIDENLEKMGICKCIEALKHFPKRFEEEFSKQSHSLLGSDLLDCCLWAEYHVTYINSFISLKEHMEVYREKCPGQVDELVTEVDGLIHRLIQVLLEQFRVEIEPFMGGLMTKNWLNTDTDFNELVNRIETYSGYSKSMRQPSAKSFASDVHYHVVKGYISELLKNKYSCKGRKNEHAADKMHDQWTELKKIFCEMGSTLDWLHLLGFQISAVIKQEHEKDIKNVLTPLVNNYPDISKKQFSAILYFRDSGFKFERSPAIQCFTELKRNTENTGNHTFFSDLK